MIIYGYEQANIDLIGMQFDWTLRLIMLCKRIWRDCAFLL